MWPCASIVTWNVRGEVYPSMRNSPLASALKGVAWRLVVTTAPGIGRPVPYSTTRPRITSSGGGGGGGGTGVGDVGVVDLEPPPQASAVAPRIARIAMVSRAAPLLRGQEGRSATSAVFGSDVQTSRDPLEKNSRNRE